MDQPAPRSRSPIHAIGEALKGLFAGLVSGLLALLTGLTIIFGILLSVLPLLLLVGAIALGVYLIVH